MNSCLEYACARDVGLVPDVAAEQRWLINYLPLVKGVVRQLASQIGGALERSDLEQIGLMGLLDALRRYGEPDDKFAGYAVMRVRGAILDELRRQDWRPRSVRQGAHRLRRAERMLRREFGREPTKAEVSGALGISEAEYEASLLADNAAALMSFDELFQDGDNSLIDQDTPETRVLDQRSLAQALAALDEREQRVIQLYYEFELSLKEIAAVLELTEARVCQINRAALKKMRIFIENA